MIRVTILLAALVVMLGCDSLSDIQDEANKEFRPTLGEDTIRVTMGNSRDVNIGDLEPDDPRSLASRGEFYYDEVKIQSDSAKVAVAPGDSEEVAGFTVRLNEKEDTPGADVLIIEATDAVESLNLGVVFWYEEPESDKKYYGHHELSIEVDG